MKANSADPALTPQGAALLAAVGVPPSLAGARAAVDTIKACLRAANLKWPDAPVNGWLSVAEHLGRTLREAAARDENVAVRLSRDPSDNCLLLLSVLKWEPPLTRDGAEFDLSAILGRAMAKCAELGTAASVDLINGAHTLRRASRSKGRRSHDWEQLLAIDFCSTDALTRIRQSLEPRSPCQSLVTQLIEVANASIHGPLPPQASVPRNSAFTGAQTEIGSAHQAPKRLTENDEIEGEQKTLQTAEVSGQDDDDARSHAPNISSRIAAADYSSFAEKLGLFHRDQLLPEDLRLVTRQLAALLRGPDRIRAGYALLALVSLITGCTDEIALNLRFAPKDTIWLDLDRKAWAWDFGAYRGHDGLPETEFEAIYCPLPVLVLHKLKELRVLAASPAETLGELVIANQRTTFDLDAFRRFLRACGDTAHPAHRGRFARSLTSVVLEHTGSDMTAAMVTGRFHATAPAALYYFGPTMALIEDRLSSVYQWLGLGDAAQSPCGSLRQGCSKVLEDQECTTGWGSLVAAIDKARMDALGAPINEVLPHVNEWMRLLALGFVVQTAHRGMRLDRLTFGALYTSHAMGTVHDKDDTLGERAQPRLIPWTESVQGLLSSALESHERVQQSGGISAIDAESPVFVQWAASNEKPTAIRTADLAPIAAKYFQSEVNFGRSQWVTSLDRHGVDRWLIRTLTGHTRDVSRTSGAYLDIPPVTAADRLRAAMESTGRKVFGSSQVCTANTRWTPTRLSPEKTDALPAQPGTKVPDPRTLLPPITARCLMGWSMTIRMRASLIEGTIDASAPVLALLHLLFIDLVVDPDYALDAVLSSDRSTYFRCFGHRHGLLWKRPHLIEPTWLPVEHSTWRLLEKAQPACIPRTHLVRDVCSAAAETLSCATWPESVADRWANLNACAQNFRRLSLPPSLCAVSAIEVPAPTLSLHSLARLAGQPSDRQLPSAYTPRITQQRSSARDESLDSIARALNKYANQTQRLGERRKRAIECRREIADAPVKWTPFARFLRAWVVDELNRARDNAPGRYQLSSLATYFSTLTLARGKVSMFGDPDEWTEDEWIDFIERTGQLAAPSASEDTSGVSERVRHAVMALVRSLRRRHLFVPQCVFERLREQAPQIAGSSSSAVLVTHDDLTRAAQLAQAWLSEAPADALLVQLRATISHEFPSRAGDLSSLAWECLTESNGLVIRRQGYNSHKTENALRIHRLSARCANAVRALRDQLAQYSPARDLLLRLDGSDAAGLRDAQLAELWATALKGVTGDRKARPHSVRAAALQEIVWPDWQARAAAWLSTTVGPQGVGAWIHHLQTNWTRTAQAAVAAGHGDLRSALGNYLAAWSLIYGMTVEALLRSSHVGGRFLVQLDIDPAALRKARSRHRTANQPRASQVFDAWAWLQGRLTRTAARSEFYTRKETPSQLPELAHHEKSHGPTTEHGGSKIDSVLYLILRTFGLTQPAAIERIGFPLTAARALESLIPDEDTAVELTRRARASVGDRGQKGNVNTALSTAGRQIIHWLIGLDPSDFEFLRICVLRANAPAAAFAHFTRWHKITESIPQGFALTVRRGSAHISQEELRFLTGIPGKLKAAVDPRIGSKPVILLCPADQENRVLTARYTSLLRAGLCSIHRLNKGNHDPD